MDEAEKAEASDALLRWLENWSGESGETTDATQEEIEAIWFGAWQACREAMMRPAEEGSYGTSSITDTGEWHRRYMKSIRGLYGT